MKYRSFLILLLMLIPVSSFALVDTGFSGGYTFGRYEEKLNDVDAEHSGYNYNGFLNVGFNLGAVFLGTGLYYCKEKLTVKRDAGDADVDKTFWGPQLIILINTSLIHAVPFARLGFSFKDQYRTEYGGIVSEKTRYLSTGFAGIGLGFRINEMLNIFFEYTHVASTYASDSQKKYQDESLNLGIRLTI